MTLGRMYFASFTSLFMSASHRRVTFSCALISCSNRSLSNSSFSSGVRSGSPSTKRFTTPSTPESGMASPTASRTLGALSLNHWPTAVSLSFFLSAIVSVRNGHFATSFKGSCNRWVNLSVRGARLSYKPVALDDVALLSLSHQQAPRRMLIGIAAVN